ncbi:MAG TPA: hypothetical protein VG963_12745, partial [Polyangiaceae bacterium]|nr:hypothetical protein [Polyangiaceae bacterium]
MRAPPRLLAAHILGYRGAGAPAGLRVAPNALLGMLIEMRGSSVTGMGSLVLVLSCGGQAHTETSRRSTTVPEAPVGAVPDAGPVKLPQQPSMAQSPSDDPAPFEEQRCPELPPPPVSSVCDPLAADPGCPAGQACFPFVRYPMGPCDVEQYGSVCLPSGPGAQGDSCEQQACAAGYVCVSTGRGTQCVRLCGLQADSPDACAPGLLCEPIDIQG